MLRLRRLDGAGMRDYLEELRPRFVIFRLITPTLRIGWAVPLWALEQTVSLALRLLPLLPALAPLLSPRARQALGARVGTTAWTGETTLRALELLLSEPWHDLLRLPRGEPFISIETSDVLIEFRQV